MLQNNPFYWGTTRKIVAAFGSLFSDIHIVRLDKNGNPVQSIEVPCNFGPKEKWLTVNTQNPMPGVDDQVEMVLPRISYDLMGFTYDSVRKLTTTGRTVAAITYGNRVMKTQFNPVPYNIGFELNIKTKTMEDGLMIVEQILPFFTPDYTISVNDMPQLNLTKDIPIVLNSVQHEDSWEGDLKVRRDVTWTLQFTVKAYLYPPVNLKTIILQANVREVLGDDPTSAINNQFTPEGTTAANAVPIVDGLGEK